MNALDRLRQRAAPLRDRLPTETERALSVPVVARIKADLDLTNADQLRAIQLEALAELKRAGGLLGAIGVGHGKQLIALLAATVLDAKRPVLMCPPGLVPVALEEAGKFGSTFKINPNLLIVPYSMLSRPEHAEILETIKPDLIVADEAHHLRHQTSARTKRVLRYLAAHPECRFVALSGTMTSRSIKDFAHLAEGALDEQSPIPRHGGELSSWAAVLDADGEPMDRDFATIRPLVEAFGGTSQVTRETARKALYTRLASTAGVVLTTDASVGASLVIRQINEPKVPEHLRDTIAEVRAEGRTPDGERVFATDEEASACARRLSLGFYYSWDWRGVDVATQLQWLDARASHSAGLRAILKADVPGLDSPALIRGEALDPHPNGGEMLPDWYKERLYRWLEVEPLAKPRTTTTWLDDFLVRDAVRWAIAAPESVILWYRDQAVADKLEELGVRRVWRGGETPTHPGGAFGVDACSIAAHGQGFNLQAWRVGRIIGCPSSGKTMEQLLGRTHRAGQLADCVVWDVYTHAPGEKSALRRAILDAQYVEESTGQKQKLRLARCLEGRGGSLADL